jgi:YbgC/YbaW family acyl-CoA thioester hydrolase
MNNQHKFNSEIKFDDCDMQGIVHHPKYFCYLERARIKAMNNDQYDYNYLLKNNMGFVITDIKSKFISPAKFGDKITIVTRVGGAYAHCVKIEQIILKNDNIQLPLDNWISNENTVMCSSLRCSLVYINNNKPVENYKEILDNLNMNKVNNIKDVSFKHPFN